MLQLFKQCWKGEAPLWKAFWIINVLVGLIISIVLAVIGVIAGFNVEYYTNTITMIQYPYAIYAAVCVWRCGKNSTFAWRVITRILIVIGLLVGLFSFFSLMQQ